MKYTIKIGCGHIEERELHGSSRYIEDTIKFLKTSICGKCYMKEQLKNHLAAGYKEVRVSYHDYKYRYSGLPYLPESYNAADRTIVVCMPPEIADRAAERKAQQGKNRQKREVKKPLTEQEKAERLAAWSAAMHAAKAAKHNSQEPIKPKKTKVRQEPLKVLPPEALLFLKKLAFEFNKKYNVACTELAKRDVRSTFNRLHLFYSSYGKKEWEQLVANNDIANLSAPKIVQLAQHYYDNTPKDEYGCVRRY